jgi:hypothetical protein
MVNKHWIPAFAGMTQCVYCGFFRGLLLVEPLKYGTAYRFYKGGKSNGSRGLSWTRSMKKIAGVKVRDNVRLLTFSS